MTRSYYVRVGGHEVGVQGCDTPTEALLAAVDGMRREIDATFGAHHHKPKRGFTEVRVLRRSALNDRLTVSIREA